MRGYSMQTLNSATKLLLSLCALAVSVSAMPAQAATLLSEGWEGTCAEVASRWADSYSRSPQTEQFPCGTGSDYFGSATHQPFSLDSGTKLFGANSLRYSYTGTQYQTPRQGGGYADRNFPGGTATEIWITFYNRMSAGFQTAGAALGGSATKGPYSFMRSQSKCTLNNTPTSPAPCGTPGAALQENGWVFHYMWGGRQLIMTAQGIKDSPPFNGQPSPYQTQNLKHNIQEFNQPDLKWVCYEAHIRLNTPDQKDGLYEQYATNVSDNGPTILTSRFTNREFVDATPTGTMPSDARWAKARTYRQDGLGQMWYDSISYTTTRVGCTGGGVGTFDTTPPAPVQNFQVR